MMESAKSKNRWTGHELKEIGKGLLTLPVNELDRSYSRDGAIAFLVKDIKAATDRGVPLEQVVAALRSRGIKAGIERVRKLVAEVHGQPISTMRTVAKGPSDASDVSPPSGEQALSEQIHQAVSATS